MAVGLDYVSWKWWQGWRRREHHLVLSDSVLFGVENVTGRDLATTMQAVPLED
jgi:kynurenine formamidase